MASLAEMLQNWRLIPPEGAEIIEASRGGTAPVASYRLPDGRVIGAPAVPQGAIDAVRAMGYALGDTQDPNAPQGYVSQEALQRGGEGLAGSAAVGSIAARAPAGALRSGMARGAGDLDPSQSARMARALEMGFESEPVYRGLKREYDPEEAEFSPQWFTNNTDVANSYTYYDPNVSAKTTNLFMKDIEPNVMPAYIRPGNMVEIDAQGAKWNEIQQQQCRSSGSIPD